MQAFKNMASRRSKKTTILTLCPRFLPSNHVRPGIFLDPVRQGGNAPSHNILVEKLDENLKVFMSENTIVLVFYFSVFTFQLNSYKLFPSVAF